MTVKELKKKLKGQFTDIRPINIYHPKAAPFTQLGEDLKGLSGKAFNNVFDKKEVVKWELDEWQDALSWTAEELFNGGVGHLKKHVT